MSGIRISDGEIRYQNSLTAASTNLYFNLLNSFFQAVQSPVLFPVLPYRKSAIFTRGFKFLNDLILAGQNIIKFPVKSALHCLKSALHCLKFAPYCLKSAPYFIKFFIVFVQFLQNSIKLFTFLFRHLSRPPFYFSCAAVSFITVSNYFSLIFVFPFFRSSVLPFFSSSVLKFFDSQLYCPRPPEASGAGGGRGGLLANEGKR
ncbi:hypothetical protein A3D23_06015 [candidate division WOR-1 bacterium RIFCSPHIGHO2_02_FULL_53_26]|nr:MAG: hypothetical protein A3D23_06015 [candidate division WOR-1 bacterium RIFCSPHIGHO2_02_FULL_53_26]